MVSRERSGMANGLNPGVQVITFGNSRLVPNISVAVVDGAGDPVPMLGNSSQGTGLERQPKLLVATILNLRF